MIAGAVLHEREAQPVRRVDLVWTGLEAKTAYARPTVTVVRELFEGATKHVLIAGYGFDHGSAIFEPLHTAMVQRSVTADIYLHIERARADQDLRSHLHRSVTAFFGANWPFGTPHPELYVAPRTIDPTLHESLHAKGCGSISYSLRFNLDGLLAYIPNTAYTQAFRHGAIEGVTYIATTPQTGQRPKVFLLRVELEVSWAVREYVNTLRSAGIEAPIVVVTSLIGVKDARVSVGETLDKPQYENLFFDRDVVVSPDVLIQPDQDDFPNFRPRAVAQRRSRRAN